jgi:hypothetical protein
LIARVLPAVLALDFMAGGWPIPSAAAEPCPDVELVFARGTGGPPEMGLVGDPICSDGRDRSAHPNYELDLYSARAAAFILGLL